MQRLVFNINLFQINFQWYSYSFGIIKYYSTLLVGIDIKVATEFYTPQYTESKLYRLKNALVTLKL